MAIYLDNAATTCVRDEVLEVMNKTLKANYGNPSSVYKIGRESRQIIEEAREKIANALGCESREVYFTSGGTEADDWAIKGVVEKYSEKGKHIITSKIEHHAVLHTCEYLEKKGYEVTYVDVDEYGIIDLQQLKESIRPDTILITIMFANNEVGSIQPIKEIGELAKENGVIFHTDAVQAVGHVDINVKDLNIDLLSLSGHKLYAPKGVGALYIKKGIKIEPLIHGGSQEKRRRAGTENVAGFVALGEAIRLANEEMQEEIARTKALRDKLIKGVLESIPHCNVNGSMEHRLPGNANISFDFIEGESILLMLDMKGIYASSGSACTSGSLDPSHVLLSMGLKHEEAHGSIRFSIGRFNTEEEIERVISELKPIIERLRAMSPLYEDYLKEQNK